MCDSAANCALRSVASDNVKNVLSLGSDGKWTVSAKVAGIWALADTRIKAGTELLLCYGGKSFWIPCFIQEEHCVVCFRRNADEDCNPLVHARKTAPGVPSLTAVIACASSNRRFLQWRM